MTSPLVFILLLFCVTGLAGPEPQEKAPLVLGQGEQRLLPLPGLKRYSLGSKVVRALPLPGTKDRLLLKGITPGIGDLWVWKNDESSEHRTVRVEKIPHEEVSISLLKAIGRLDEAEIILSGKGAVIRGEIQSFSEARTLGSLLRGYPQSIVDETTLSKALMQIGINRLKSWIDQSPFQSKLRIEPIGTALWIRGSVDRPTEKNELEKQLREAFPLVKLDIESLPDHAPTVYFQVTLLELKRNHFQTLGLSWPGIIQDGFQVTTGGIKDLLQVNLTLQALQGTGHARILSNPELAVRAPGEAELFAGGELPIQTQNRYASNVTWKNYGLTLRLKISHVTGERIRLDIFTEVSHLDPHISADRIPGFQSNRMKTQVDARFRVPLLLSGLLQQGLREEVRGLPFLRNLPVLGALFGSEDYLNEQSELVAVLYPHATPPVVPAEFKSIATPKGPIPPPRNWISPREERLIRQSKEYPWNALE